ncbi:MAG: hypothetical protein WDN48_17120 [Pseudolabrys sp.]
MHDIGQKAADLDLRMNAGCDPAQDLYDVITVNDHAAVGLLAVYQRDGLDLGQRRVSKGRGRPKLDFLLTVARGFAGVNFGEQSGDEFRLGGGMSSVPSRGPRRTAASTELGPLSIWVKRSQRIVSGMK